MVRPQLAQHFAKRDDENVWQCLRLVIGTADEADEGRRFVQLISTTSFSCTRQKRGRILPRNNNLASDVSLTCKHSSCHTLPSTSTTFDSKFAHHGVANAAHKLTHIMTVRVASFTPHQTPRGCSVQLDQCQSLPSHLRHEETFSSSESSGVLLVFHWPWYCRTSPESSVTRVDCSSSLFLTEFALWATKNSRNLLPASDALWVSLGIIL